MDSFKVVETRFQMFIKSRMYMDDEYVKSIDERAKHKKVYNNWVNERLMQTTEDKVDSSKALDASLVDTKSSGTALKEQDISSRSGNDAHADDADIRHIYNEKPMAEVQTTAEINIFATRQQHIEQPEFNNKGEVDQNADNVMTNVGNWLYNHVETNGLFRQIDCVFSLNDLDFQSNGLPTQVDVNNDLSKPVTTHYLPKERESLLQKLISDLNLASSRWVPTRKIFTSSTTKVDSEPTNGLNDDITNQYECKQTLDVRAGTLNLNVELGIHDHNNEPSSSKLVPKVRITIPPSHCNAEVNMLYGGDGIPFQLKSDSLPHAHAQATKIYYKHQDSRIKKVQGLKTRLPQTLILKISPHKPILREDY
ncbi:hypothetical protein Tco_0718948 [Tanacetum coccineum]